MRISHWYALGLLLIIIFGCAGIIALRSGSAVSYVLSAEAEAGTKAGAANAGPVASASGDASVRFAGQVAPRKLKIMPLGDSITDGFNTYPGSYRPRLWQKLVTGDKYELDFVGSLSNGDNTLPDKNHEGHSGWRVDEINGSIGDWLNTYDPGVILLHIGTNDIFQDASGSTIAGRLDTLVNTIFSRKPDVTLLVASLIPLRDNGVWNGEPWRQFNQSVPLTVNKYKAQGRDIVFVDMATQSGITQGNPDLPDGVHPSASGGAKMADVWYPALKPLFTRP